jgi:autotransporter strand-loop-strand O-heptosyltransferase
MKILAHTSFIGTTGYANHAKSFFCALNKYHTVKVRNSTIGGGWKGFNETPHDDESYMTDEIKGMLYQQTLINSDGSRSDFPMYSYDRNFKPDVHIVLAETNNHYFYDQYDGYKIAYNVWESTRYDSQFFNKLMEFDEVWVPSQWQYDCLVEQGYPENKISIVPEGVDVNVFKPIEKYPKRDKIQFVHFGRWDYRKGTTELLQSFAEEFKDVDDIELIASVENPYASDGLKSTEDRINFHKIDTKNIKFIDFTSREDYVKYLQTAHVFVSCARSEGWNLPLIEAMACGTPSIYSNWGGQLQFAEGHGIPVAIKGLKPANVEQKNFQGEYCEPDWEDLRYKMRQAYDYHTAMWITSRADSKRIHKDFNWDKIAKDTCEILKKYEGLTKEKNVNIYYDGIEITSKELKKYVNDYVVKNRLVQNNKLTERKVNINFIDGPFVEILENDNKLYHVEFINKKTNKVEYELNLRSNHWARCSIKYYVDWVIKIKGIYDDFTHEHHLDLKGKRVMICYETKSLGDTLSYFPYVEKFRVDNECHVVCSTFNNDFFIDQYPKIQFVKPGDNVNNIYALYRFGMFFKTFDDGRRDVNYEYHPIDPKTVPLSKIASDILGLEYIELRPKLKKLGKEKKKMVCIAPHSTAQSKYWNNPTGWQEVVDHLNNKGYEVRLLSKEEDGFMGNRNPLGVVRQPEGPITEVMKTLQESELFIGLGSGLSWLAWSVETPTILISGFSDTYTEPVNGVSRIINKNVCNGCWNRHNFDPGDWNWCPDHKGTDRQFECSKNITSEQVIKEIDLILS